MNPSATQSVTAPFHLDEFLVEVADVVNTTLDLDTLLQRTAELVRRVIDYEIFAILLLNEKTQELRIRFQIGHPPEVAERMRVKVGEGVTGRAASHAKPCWSTTLPPSRTQLHQAHCSGTVRVGGAADR